MAVGAPLDLGGFTIEPNARARYAHISLDGYTESGAADKLTVSGRDVSL